MTLILLSQYLGRPNQAFENLGNKSFDLREYSYPLVGGQHLIVCTYTCTYKANIGTSDQLLVKKLGV